MDLAKRKAVYEAAKALHADPSDDNIEMDDVELYLAGGEVGLGDPLVGRFSEPDDDSGCWIQAWVWVSAADIEQWI